VSYIFDKNCQNYHFLVHWEKIEKNSRYLYNQNFVRPFGECVDKIKYFDWVDCKFFALHVFFI